MRLLPFTSILVKGILGHARDIVKPIIQPPEISSQFWDPTDRGAGTIDEDVKVAISG